MVMTSIRYVVGLAALLCVTAVPAAAQKPLPNVNDGQALMRECGEAINQRDNEGRGSIGTRDEMERGSDMGQCLGLVNGVWFTHLLMVDEFGSREAFCADQTISAGQMARIVYAYLQDHPAELEMWDTVLILRAFANEFPCS